MWTPWQRVEVLNALRQAERTGIVEPGESQKMIHFFEQEVRLGYWPHVEFDWSMLSAHLLSFRQNTLSRWRFEEWIFSMLRSQSRLAPTNFYPLTTSRMLWQR
jgi:hypothetical protein